MTDSNTIQVRSGGVGLGHGALVIIIVATKPEQSFVKAPAQNATTPQAGWPLRAIRIILPCLGWYVLLAEEDHVEFRPEYLEGGLLLLRRQRVP